MFNTFPFFLMSLLANALRQTLPRVPDRLEQLSALIDPAWIAQALGILHHHCAVIGTLGLGWLFTNLIFMMHYAHMHYNPGPEPGLDAGGFDFPATNDPDYWDFLYFSFTAGMSFAASDVNVTRGEVRRIVVLQCLLAFFFNIGALAFTINVLAGAAG